MSDQHNPPKEFIRISAELKSAILTKNIPRLRSALHEATIERDKVFNMPTVGWWNSLLNLGQLFYAHLCADSADMKRHECLDKDSDTARLLFAFRKFVFLSKKQLERAGFSSKSLDDLILAGFVCQPHKDEIKYRISSSGLSALEDHSNYCTKISHDCVIVEIGKR